MEMLPSDPGLPRSPTLKQQGYLPARYIVCMMSFIGTMMCYILRVNINFSIMAMVQQRGTLEFNTTEEEDANICNFSNIRPHIKQEYLGEFDWDEWTQAQIIGSFYLGYICSQIPGGRLAERFGGSQVVGISMTIAAILNLLLPLAAYNNYSALITVRVLLGIAEGATFPALQALLVHWAPPQERSWLLTLVFIGSMFGIIIAYPASAALIKLWGWTATFYVPGCVTLIWCCMWCFIVSNTPNEFRWISQYEKNYIAASIGDTVRGARQKSPSLPIKSMLKSMAFWSTVVNGIGASFGYFTLLTYMPVYMETMLHYDMHMNAMLSGLPYLGFVVVSIAIGSIGDTLRQRSIITTVTLRKASQTICNLGPAICLICVTFLECERDMTIALLFISIACQGGEISGWIVNSVDLAPNFAGTLTGISNALATSAGWIAPLIVAALTNDQQTFAQWHKVFYIISGIYIGSTLFYLIFASGEVQNWNFTVPQLDFDDKEDDGKSQEEVVIFERSKSYTYEGNPCREVNGFVNTGYFHD